jgi:hypothetical protein
MSTFTAAENFEVHVSNMNYTAIQNMKAKAFDDEDWDKLDEAYELEADWEKSQ